jgi:hypothetical protein
MTTIDIGTVLLLIAIIFAMAAVGGIFPRRSL